METVAKRQADFPIPGAIGLGRRRPTRARSAPDAPTIGRLLSLGMLCLWGALPCSLAPADAAERRPLPGFDRVVIDDHFPGGYQVEVADVNGDGKVDVIGLGGGTCAWYENPGWTKHVVSTSKETPGIISSATADLDGDGKAEILIAYEFNLDQPTKGKLVLATQAQAQTTTQGGGPDAWTFRPIADIGSIHRLRLGDADGDRRPELIVAPIVGPTAKGPGYDQSPARLVAFRAPGRPAEDRWVEEPIGERPLLHGIKVLDVDGDGRVEVLTADKRGVALFDRGPGEHGTWTSRDLVAGAPGGDDGRGASEVQVGRLADGIRFLATVEPWHGTQIAIYRAEHPGAGLGPFGARTVIERNMRDGHALWVADVDGDGDDEVFAGFRGPGTSVIAFDTDDPAEHWTRTLLDPAIAAQDLRGADLDADGVPDFVAIGGKSHNVVWYRPRHAGQK